MKNKAALFFCLAYLLSASSAFSQTSTQKSTPQSKSLRVEFAQNVTETSAAPAAQPNQGNLANLQPAGQVVWVNGKVKANYPDQTPRILGRGSYIYEKDTIVTEANGSGQIAFTDNSMVSLMPNTTFVVEQYYFNPGKPSEESQYLMNMIKGGFRTITGFIAKAAPGSYQIKTPVATIGVRGTDYQVSCASASGNCLFSLLHGTGVVLTNYVGSYTINPETPYATIVSNTTKAVLSKLPPGPEKTLEVLPASALTPTMKPSGNCGILVN